MSYLALIQSREDHPWPSDLYLEGSDQHRGWFHSSLIIAVNDREAAPYRSVLTHGFTLDGQGRKMSKSLGNVIPPQDVIQRHGGDVLRLWVATVDFLEDMRLSQEILDRNAEAYRKIRNTCRYLLGNLYDFDASRHALPPGDLEEIDRWILGQLNQMIVRARSAYERYEFHVATQAIHRFSTVTLSALYLDVLKDRLYTSPPEARLRRSAQTTMHIVLDSLTRLMAPVLCFTAEEVWQAMRGREPGAAIDESVHTLEFPRPVDRPVDDGLDPRREPRPGHRRVQPDPQPHGGRRRGHPHRLRRSARGRPLGHRIGHRQRHLKAVGVGPVRTHQYHLASGVPHDPAP